MGALQDRKEERENWYKSQKLNYQTKFAPLWAAGRRSISTPKAGSHEQAFTEQVPQPGGLPQQRGENTQTWAVVFRKVASCLTRVSFNSFMKGKVIEIRYSEAKEEHKFNSKPQCKYPIFYPHTHLSHAQSWTKVQINQNIWWLGEGLWCEGLRLCSALQSELMEPDQAS